MRCEIAILRPAVTALAAALLAVAGCSQPERLDTPETRDERLKLPPDLVSPRTDNAMEVPALAGAGDEPGGSESNRPVLPETIGVTLERGGGLRWLRVDAEPRQVYRWARSYIQRLGVEAARQAPQLGILETGWIYYGAPVTRGVFAPVVQEADAAEVADRYRIRLERGTTAGTTDVFVAHQRIQRGDSAPWRRAAAEPFLEAEFLRGFMLYLGVTEAESLQRLRSAGAGDAGARLVRLDSGETALRLAGGAENGWQRVNQALDRAGFTVVSRDSGQRAVVVRYDPEASTRESDDDSAVPRYRLVLQSSGGAGVLTVEPMAEAPAEEAARVGERILALIRQQLG